MSVVDEGAPPHYLNGDRVWYIELGNLAVPWPGVIVAIHRTVAGTGQPDAAGWANYLPPDPADDTYNVLLVETGEIKREVSLWKLAPRKVAFKGDDVVEVPTS